MTPEEFEGSRVGDHIRDVNTGEVFIVIDVDRHNAGLEVVAIRVRHISSRPQDWALVSRVTGSRQPMSEE